MEDCPGHCSETPLFLAIPGHRMEQLLADGHFGFAARFAEREVHASAREYTGNWHVSGQYCVTSFMPMVIATL
jgi:hypothetical protein